MGVCMKVVLGGECHMDTQGENSWIELEMVVC